MKKIIAIAGFLGIFASGVNTSFAGYFNTQPIDVCQSQITRSLQVGSENNDVYLLQGVLSAAGFLQAAPNGYFGYQTQRAVKVFQMNNGLPVTGAVGEATRNALNERLCDTDLIDNQIVSGYSNYSEYGQMSGITYVGATDPFVRVVTPQEAIPVVYPTAQSDLYGHGASASLHGPSAIIQNSPLTPSFAQTSQQIAGTNIIYNPSTGYGYGITPQSGSMTVSSPVANAVYQEGDTVYVRFTTTNLTQAPYSILLENNISGQSKTVATISNTSYQFVLTKELLDAVCAGVCDANQQGSFRVVVTVPTVDIARNTSTLRAAIAPITIRRPLAQGKLTLTASKTPVASGEGFRLYVNAPIISFGNLDVATTYTLRVKAVCPSSLTVSLAGAGCGQDIVIPFEATRLAQGIPVIITNPTWYKQDVTFSVALFTPNGQISADTSATVSVNAAPFSW